MLTALLFAVSIHWSQLTLPPPTPPAATIATSAAVSHPGGQHLHPGPRAGANATPSRPAQTPARVAQPRVGAPGLDNPAPQAAGAGGSDPAPADPAETQLPTEVQGRQITCPDGTVVTMDATGRVVCP